MADMTRDERRPDPDELLARVEAEEARQRRGRLKIFFGASPGVGKTFAMLTAARGCASKAAMWWSDWSRPMAVPRPQRLLEGLDLLPRRGSSIAAVALTEFDLDAALARKPARAAG